METISVYLMAAPDSDCTKGSVIRHVFDFIEETFGVDAKSRLIDLALECNLKYSAITAASWFPTADYFKLLNTAIAQFAGTAPKELCITLGKYILSHDLRGIYRIFVSMLPQQAVISKAGRIWRQYHSKGAITVDNLTHDSCILTLSRDKDPNLYEWYIAVGGAIATIEVSGGKNAKYEILKGDHHGSLRFTFRCTWN